MCIPQTKYSVLFGIGLGVDAHTLGRNIHYIIPATCGVHAGIIDIFAVGHH